MLCILWQYFLWYLWLLPAALPRISMTWRRAAFVGTLWIAGQVRLQFLQHVILLLNDQVS